MPWIILGPSFLFLLLLYFDGRVLSSDKRQVSINPKTFWFLSKVSSFFWNKCLVRSREEVHFNLEGKHLNYSIRCKYWKEKGTTAPKKSVLDKQNIEAAPSSQWLKNVPKSLICWEFLTKQFGQNRETFFKSNCSMWNVMIHFMLIFKQCVAFFSFFCQSSNLIFHSL